MSEEILDRSGSKKTDEPELEISTLKLREIQAPLMACLLAGFINDLSWNEIKKSCCCLGKPFITFHGIVAATRRCRCIGCGDAFAL